MSDTPEQLSRQTKKQVSQECSYCNGKGHNSADNTLGFVVCGNCEGTGKTGEYIGFYGFEEFMDSDEFESDEDD